MKTNLHSVTSSGDLPFSQRNKSGLYLEDAPAQRKTNFSSRWLAFVITNLVASCFLRHSPTSNLPSTAGFHNLSLRIFLTHPTLNLRISLFFFFCKILKENFFVLFIYEWINEKFPESIFRTIEKHRLVIRPIDFAPSSNYGLEGNHTGYEDKSVNNITWSIYSINY